MRRGIRVQITSGNEASTARRSGRSHLTALFALVVLVQSWAGSAQAQDAGEEGEAPTAVTTAAEIPPPPPPPPPSPQVREELVLLFTSDLEGRLADAPCGAQGENGALLPRIAAVVGQERGRAASNGLQAPLVLDVGDALFPSPLVNDIGGNPQNATALAQAIRRAGYDALAAGDLTIAAPREGLYGIARAARAAGAPLLASNFVCGEEADEQECQGASRASSRTTSSWFAATSASAWRTCFPWSSLTRSPPGPSPEPSFVTLSRPLVSRSEGCAKRELTQSC